MALLFAYKGTYGNRRGWFIEFEYDFDQIQELKRLAPHADRLGQARAWCEERGENGEWWVAEEYASNLLEIWPKFRTYLEAVPLPGFGEDLDGGRNT